MKHIFFLLLLSSTIAHLAAQQNEPIKANINTDYLKKSKKQKTVAWILLGGGSALLVTSFALPDGEFLGYTADLKEEYENDDLRAGIFLAGVVSNIASIPFFISSKKNQKKGIDLSAGLKMETMYVRQARSYTSTEHPALSVKLSFR